jgi:guanosine-3',5'-bis(diphosphate) 3'-pyrophosphohydrolase
MAWNDIFSNEHMSEQIFELNDDFQQALSLAAHRHKGQNVPGTELPYLVHVFRVTMEVMNAGFVTPGFDANFGITVAILHDSMEDTDTSYEEITNLFGKRIADGVLALTKFENLEKSEQMKDSILRIKELEKEIWAVKLADRITNLDAPPLDWDEEKRKKYMDGANMILEQLGEGNEYLANRLRQKISNYVSYVTTGDK